MVCEESLSKCVDRLQSSCDRSSVNENPGKGPEATVFFFGGSRLEADQDPYLIRWDITALTNKALLSY